MKYILLVLTALTIMSCKDSRTDAMNKIADNLKEKSDCNQKIHDLELTVMTLKAQLRVYEVADSVYFANRKQ